MLEPNFEGMPFDMARTHTIKIEMVDVMVDGVWEKTGWQVTAYGPCPMGTSRPGTEPHVLGRAATYEEADAIRSPAWDAIHIARKLRNVTGA